MNPKYTKMTFNEKDIQLMNDCEIIDRKVNVIKSVANTFKDILSNLYQQSDNWVLASDLIKQHGKITQGENHFGYPFVILDYPRNFERDNIFCLRHLFWWGNFYSCTLHISGIDNANNFTPIRERLKKISESGFGISNSSKKWSNHQNSYKQLAQIEKPSEYANRFFEKNNFIRIMKSLDMQQVNKMNTFSMECSNTLFGTKDTTLQ